MDYKMYLPADALQSSNCPRMTEMFYHPHVDVFVVELQSASLWSYIHLEILGWQHHLLSKSVHSPESQIALLMYT